MKTSIYLLLVVVTFASVAVGQSHHDKLEVGVHSTSLTVFHPDFVGDITHGGVGGRVTYNLNQYFAAEVEVNFFPTKQQSFSTEGNAIQGQFGLKAGKRFQKFGIFAKLRPGVLSVDDVFTVLPGPIPIVNGIAQFNTKIERTNYFTLDVGGVLEFYPSKRLVVRFDGGDTLIRYPERFDILFGTQSPTVVRTRGPKFEHNFQFTAGVGFRLGDFPADDANVATPSTQEGVPRFEVGAQFTSMFVDDPTDDCGFCLVQGDQRIHVEPGFGGRFTVNLTEKIAVEAEGNYFTRRRFDFPNPGGHMYQGQFGAKVGKRYDNWGWFVKGRPGFVGFTRVFELMGEPFFFSDSRFVKKRYLSFDVGGVLEFYVSRHWMARFDIGDTIIRYGALRTPQFIQSMPVFTRPAETRHNLQVTSGIGFRF